MVEESIKLTVLYQVPFWVGIFERISNNTYSVGRTIFGGEPSEVELFEFIINEFDQIRFSEPGKEKQIEIKKKSPKRILREVRNQITKVGLVSKAQEALRIELEKNKLLKKKDSKQQREEREQMLFDMRQEKKKKKKRGH